MKPISRETHRAALEDVRRAVERRGDPIAGIYGPRSRMWRHNRESVIFLGGGRAALLQAAHPFVAHAVSEHSKTKTDLPGRFQRTFLNVFDMVFGDLDNALKSAKRVHNIHTRVHGVFSETVGAFAEGSPYQANDVESVHWVHATLLDTSIQVTELVFGALPREEKEALYQETKRFAYLFGLRDDDIPPRWGDFRTYMREMLASDHIAVGSAASDIRHFLLIPPNGAVKPAWDVYSLMTAGLLPPRLREAYGFRWRRRDRALFEATLEGIRRAYKRIPRRLRYLPAYVDAKRRIAGKPGSDLYGQIMQRVVLASLKQRKAA